MIAPTAAAQNIQLTCSGFQSSVKHLGVTQSANNKLNTPAERHVSPRPGIAMIYSDSPGPLYPLSPLH
ncbi:hypothetical protein N8612_00075 [Verrucomicrobia bacterium]|nr:hypothetical protein [Verrucomicrobiota bacterium]